MSPLNFIKFNFGTNLYFTHCSVFFLLEEKKEVVRFQFRERKCLLVRNLATKIVIFYIKWFHMMKKVKIICVFFLPWKHIKNQIWVQEFFIFFWVDFKFYSGFFMFFVVVNWFNKIYMVFPKCFGQKIGWKWVFW